MHCITLLATAIVPTTHIISSAAAGAALLAGGAAAATERAQAQFERYCRVVARIRVQAGGSTGVPTNGWTYGGLVWGGDLGGPGSPASVPPAAPGGAPGGGHGRHASGNVSR
jgi:hypothetical protein